MSEPKISKKDQSGGAITADSTDLYNRSKQALESGYSMAAVDAKTLFDLMESKKNQFIPKEPTEPPKCWCHSCWDEKGSKSVQTGVGLMHFDKPFIVCPDCGNKRCPKATHHNNKCTGSNEIGQKGSIYGGLEDSKESS